MEAAADCAVAAVPLMLRVLDVGCGDGALLRELTLRVPYGERFVGIDADPAMVALARTAPDARIEYRTGDVVALPFEAAAFDLVVALRTFTSWADQQAGLREIARVLRPAGTAVVVDRLATGPKGPGRLRSKAQVAAAAGEAGLQSARVERLTRRLGVLTGLHGYVLVRRVPPDARA